MSGNEIFGILGTTLGMFGVIAFIKLQELAKEVADLKTALTQSGALEKPPES
jgi:hypothetical protein